MDLRTGPTIAQIWFRLLYEISLWILTCWTLSPSSIISFVAAPFFIVNLFLNVSYLLWACISFPRTGTLNCKKFLNTESPRCLESLLPRWLRFLLMSAWGSPRAPKINCDGLTKDCFHATPTNFFILFIVEWPPRDIITDLLDRVFLWCGTSWMMETNTTGGMIFSWEYYNVQQLRSMLRWATQLSWGGEGWGTLLPYCARSVISSTPLGL